jgi:hypothetical protein
MAPTYRCTCTTHKCKDVVDATGQPGVMLNARNLRNHTQDDKNAAVYRIAQERQRKVLNEEEARLSTAVRTLSITDIPGVTKPLPDQDKYRADAARRLVSHISETMDRLSLLQIDIDSIEVPSGAPVEDHTILATLQQLGSIRSSVETLDSSLKTIGRSKIPSVVSMRQEGEAVVASLLVRIRDIENPWQDLHDARDAQHKNLASDATTYDSGVRRSVPDQRN